MSVNTTLLLMAAEGEREDEKKEMVMWRDRWEKVRGEEQSEEEKLSLSDLWTTNTLPDLRIDWEIWKQDYRSIQDTFRKQKQGAILHHQMPGSIACEMLLLDGA